MCSDAQADAAIEAFGRYIDEAGEMAYARKEYSRPLATTESAPPPVRLRTLMAATKADTINKMLYKNNKKKFSFFLCYTSLVE